MDTRESLEDACDRVWRAAILHRDKFKCRRCGEPATDAAHIYSRGVHAVRWLLENGVALCRRCHDGFHVRGGWLAFVRLIMPEAVFRRLTLTFMRSDKSPVRLTEAHLRKTLRGLRRAVRAYGGVPPG